MLQTEQSCQLLQHVGIQLAEVSSVSPNGHDWHLPSQLPMLGLSQSVQCGLASSVANNPLAIHATISNSDPEQPEHEAVEDVLLADPELKKPQLYAVVMYNDDYTPMEFVVAVLQDHFKHNIDSAVNIMLSIHHHGKGVAGIYPKDIAETKAQTVNRQARQAGYPLLTQIEPQPDG